MEATYEIIVWVKGHTTGHIFKNKSIDLARDIIECTGSGRGFKLNTEDGIRMAFGPGMVTHAQVIREKSNG